MAVLSQDVASYLVVLRSMIDSISKSKYRNKVVLIGGYTLDARLLECGMGDLCRKTIDIDLDIKSLDDSIAFFGDIEGILNSNDLGIRFIVKGKKEWYPIGAKIIFSVESSFLSADVHIDSNIRDVDKIEICPCADIGIPVYSSVSAIVDKLSAISTQKIFRRVKDIYDLYCYSYMDEYRLQDIRRVLTERRPESMSKLRINISPDNYEGIWHAYHANSTLRDEVFDDVIERAGSFVNALISLLINDVREEYLWDIKEGVWRECV